MTDAGRFKRVLLSLPDPRLRIDWLEDQLTRVPREVAAQLLNALVEESESADPGAREVFLTIALVFVGRAETTLAKEMRREAALQRLFSLERMLRQAPRPPSPSMRPEELAVPDYGFGRELSLGERRSLARKPHRRAFEKLLSDPHPLVIGQLLQNPKMVEDDAIRIAARRPANTKVLGELARNPRWVSRARVRMALLLNPGTPAELSVPLLGLCTRPQLRTVITSTEAVPILRVTARELLARRPPMSEEAGPHTIQ